MKLKYYLRGLGIGILVTAAILKISNPGNTQAMSDEEVKKRAAELGMIENTVLKTDNNVSDNSIDFDEKDSESSNTISESENAVSDSNIQISISDSNVDVSVNEAEAGKDKPAIDKEQDKNKDKEKDTNRTDEKPVKDNNDKSKEDDKSNLDNKNQNIKNDTEYVTISVVKGDSSFSVAKKIVSAGLADSAAELDKFLCEHDYDKTLTVGSHKIPKNASMDEIGKILTSKVN